MPTALLMPFKIILGNIKYIQAISFTKSLSLVLLNLNITEESTRKDSNLMENCFCRLNYYVSSSKIL